MEPLDKFKGPDLDGRLMIFLLIGGRKSGTKEIWRGARAGVGSSTVGTFHTPKHS